MIREARTRQHLTQDELAIEMQLENIEISQKGVSGIEEQERFVADFELRGFFKVLKLDISELFSMD